MSFLVPILSRVRFTQGSSGRIIGTILDRDGVVVPASALSAATLTLWDHDTREIINNRNAEDVLGFGSPAGDHGVTIHETLQTDLDGDTYNLEWLLEAADNPILTARRQVERHRALFRFTSLTDVLPMEFEIDVDNLQEAGNESS